MRFFRWDKRIAWGLVCLFIVALVSVPIFLYGRKYSASQNVGQKQLNEVFQDAESTDSSETAVAEAVPTKLEIKKAPPKRIAQKPPRPKTVTKSDGTQQTTMTEGGIAISEIESVGLLSPVGANPYAIRFSDETGQNSALEGTLKDYLNNNLKWNGEVSTLYKVTIRNAGDVGWEGQYGGSYITDQSGTIVSAFGYIVLNTFYHQSSPNFTDYMKYVFAHEYGHHFTLYNKWVKMNLSNDVRFPDYYYNTRPLSKSSTSVDYSLGWQNCEAEIIAEDYAYFYSGFAYHSMVSEFGMNYPSTTIKSWMNDNLAIASEPLVAVDNPPVLSIVSPTLGQELAGQFEIKADAGDDHGILKVDFYIDDILILSDNSAPYATTVNANNLPGGAHRIVAIAHDSTTSITKEINVMLLDQWQPSITMTPDVNPYDWSTKENLIFAVIATDNTTIKRLKLYVNDALQDDAEFNTRRLEYSFSLSKRLSIGAYNIRIEVIDQDSNMGTKSFIVNKLL